MRSRSIFLLSILAVIFSSTASAQCTGSVIGTWRLLSVTAKTDKGGVDKAILGQNPSGLLTYTEDGRKLLSIADRVAAPKEERAKAYSTFMAYGVDTLSLAIRW
jgi:hypothetical protein